MVKAGFGQLFCCHPHILDSCDALGFIREQPAIGNGNNRDDHAASCF